MRKDFDPTSPPPLAEPSPGPRRGVRLALAGLVVLAGGYFFLRGPYRAWNNTVDLHVFYAASRAWLEGSNPYDQANLDAVFARSGGLLTDGVDSLGRATSRRAPGPDRHVNLSLNPPTTFVVLAPLAALPWPLAQNAFTVLSLALLAPALAAAAQVAGLRWRQDRTWLLLAAALALAPLHTSISQGQMTIPVTVLAVMSLRQELARRSLGAGVLLALAAALKPQMGLALLAVPLVRGRWKTALAAAGGLGLLGALAAGRMALSGIHWLGLYANQVGAFVGAQADPTLANPGAYLMIDLRPLLHTVIASRLAVNVLTFAAVVLAGGLLAWWLRRCRGPRAELLLYSGAAVLGLLAFYNRAYSAAVLVLPLAWATACLDRGDVRAAAWAVIAAVLVFVLPGSAILGTLADAGRLPFDPRSPAWRATVMMHQTWALLILAGALLLAARRQGARPLLDPPGAWKDN